MTTHKTNLEFLTHMMEYSKHGPLMELFIIDALTKWSQYLIEHQDEFPEDHPMISKEAWVGCAKELKEAVERHLSGAPEPEVEARLLDEGEE